MSEHEPNTIDALVARYEASGLGSQTYSFTTGPDETRAIGDLWRAEHVRVAQAFRLSEWTLSHCIDDQFSMIFQHNQFGELRRPDGTSAPTFSDDRLTRLMFNGNVQMLASMVEARDMFNCQVVQIARYPLRDGTISSLERLVDFDNEYRAKRPDAPEPYSK